jgi:hypothetical protein
MTTTLTAERLPVPWGSLGQASQFDIGEFIDQLAAQKWTVGSPNHDLLVALRHAASRLDDDPWKLPYHTRYAYVVLEIAIEWSMPAVERWAVAWLTEIDGSHLRLRWSSRSRDGKVRRNGRALTSIDVMTTVESGVMIGCREGQVATWTDEGGLGSPEHHDLEIWCMAAAGGRVVIGGASGHLVTNPSDWTLPSLGTGQRLAGVITAVAISPDGYVACGDINGGVWIHEGTGDWGGLDVEQPRSSRATVAVRALAFLGNTQLTAVWENGLIATAKLPARGRWAAQEPRLLRGIKSLDASGSLIAAAIDPVAGRLAVACHDVVYLAGVGETEVTQAWPHPGVTDLAWSPEGLLASSGGDLIYLGEPFAPGAPPLPIAGDGVGGPVAFLDADHLVTALGTDIAQWAVREAGSFHPDSRFEEDVTAVALDPATPSRVLAGTKHGRLLSYDRDGSLDVLIANLHGQVYQIAASGAEWLIAAQTGAYRWAPPPGTPPLLLGDAKRCCRAVAASNDDALFASGRDVFTWSHSEPLSFDKVVEDARFGPDGSVAAVDQNGTIRGRDRAGVEWSVPGSFARSGLQLISAKADAVVIWDPEGRVLEMSRSGASRQLGTSKYDIRAAFEFGQGRLAIVRRTGGLAIVTLHDEEWAAATGVTGQPMTASTAGRRIVAASGKRVVVFDLLEPSQSADGTVTLSVRSRGADCHITLPDDNGLVLDRGRLSALRFASAAKWGELLESASSGNLPPEALREGAARLTVEEQSRLISEASLLGDQLWWSGVDLAVDRARGRDPNRPIRIEWQCDAESDDIPWELVSPSAAPLGWFSDPPVTAVRSIKPSAVVTGGKFAPRGPLTRPSMLVIRGEHRELRSSETANAKIRRRTRRSNVSLLEPTEIKRTADLAQGLPEQVDIVQLWAHCGPEKVWFSDSAEIQTAELADVLASRAPRLVILIGCRSGALGRALVERGVEAVVAMRVEVYSQTIQPLVTEIVSFVLDGVPVDLAFASALRSYVLTGQPGAAAVPLLYLAEGSNGILFPPSASAKPS